MLFFKASAIFLGHVLSVNRISANLEKVDKVRHRSVPKNIKGLHSFLGLASYNHQFIPSFVHMARCWHKLYQPELIKPTFI